MNKAEKRALEAYPYDYPERTGFRQGYEQAEKDLTLTWKDIDMILKISADMLDDRDNSPIGLEKEWCQQVLRIFNLKKHE